MSNRKFIKIVGIFLLIVIVLVSPFMRIYYSLIFSSFHQKEEWKTIVRKNEVIIDLKGGFHTPFRNDWYPDPQAYYAGEKFGQYVGKNVFLTLYYNFPDFHFLKGYSNVFRENSPYYSSFYGAAVVKSMDQPYGFCNTEKNESDFFQIEELIGYSYERLLLRQFGFSYKESVLSLKVDEKNEGLPYCGYSDFTMIKGRLLINGCAHAFKGFEPAYLRYGFPGKGTADDFGASEMYIQVYCKYFSEFNISIFFFVWAKNPEVLHYTDEKLLSESKIIK